MPRPVLAVSAALLLSLALAGCSAPTPQATGAAPELTPSATPSAGASSAPVSPSGMPGCDAITAALGGLVDGLAYDKTTSDTNTADEAYAQRVCVFVSPDGATQLGVTLAAIPFQQTEIDGYAALPNAVADDRLAAHDGVLQVFAAGDADDGHLDSQLYLIDTALSITIQGITAGGSTRETLPQLTVPAAIDGAFAVRALVG